MRRRTHLAASRLEDRTTPSTLIPVTGARDLVFDALRNRLYVTTSAGSVARYDAVAGTLLSPVVVGTSHNGADVTPSGQYLFVAENQRGPTQGFFHRIDLTDPGLASTLVPYNIGFGEGGAWDIAIGPTGSAITTTRYEGSGWVDVRFLDTATGGFTMAGRSVRQDTHLARSTDRTRVFLTESNISSGPVATYTFASGFGPTGSANQFFGSVRSAVNRDGTLLASEVGSATVVTAPNFDAVEQLVGFDGGMVFDPVRDVLYAVNSSTDQFVVFDTTTWREKYREPVGENVSTSGAIGVGTMAVNADGSAVYLVTASGVRRFDLPANTGVASRLAISNVSTYRAAGTTTTVTVTALDPAGNVATGFTGMVTFSSNDPAAVLPGPYTFTAADAGVKTFQVTWNTAGNRTLTVNSSGLPGVTSPTVVVHSLTAPAALALIARRDLVYDTAHNLLLITTSDGTVERYDPVTRSLLAPLAGRGSYNGADVTADGSALVVADGQRSLTQSVVRRIDPLTGATTLLRHAGDGGAWDVVLPATGVGLVDYRFEGSGWVNLDFINLTTGTLTSSGRSVRQNSNIVRGAGRNLFFVTESNISSGPIFTYNPATGTFPSSASTQAFLDNNLAAINRDGTLIALEFGSGTTVMNGTLGTVRMHAGIDGGVAFDPVRDVLYGVNSATDRIDAFDTTTGALKYSLPVGENVPASTALSSGVMTVSGDGRWLFLSTPSGVRIYDVATRLAVTIVPGSVGTGGTAQIQVAAQTPTGVTDTGYRGTVTFSSSDGAATLPGSYTFTAGDGGVRSFPAVFRTVGSQTVTVSDGTSVAGVASVTVRPATVATTVANPGATQRSRVTSIQVTFSTQVTFTGSVAAAFTVSRIGGSAVGSFTATASVVDGVTVVTLSNFSGAETEFGSLADGRYVVQVRAGQVSAGGAAIDGNGDGTAGDDYMLTGSVANGLYRLFGDANADGTVNAADFSVFRPAFGSSTGQAAYLDWLDFDGDGTINAFDFSQFRPRFGASVP